MNRILVLCLITVFALSCQTENPQVENTSTEWGGFSVASDFKWKTSSSLPIQYSGASTLELYDANMAFIATVTSANIQAIHLPASATKLYVFETNSNLGTWVEVTSSLNLNAVKFEAAQPTNKAARESNVRNSSCSSCTRTIASGNNLNITIATNEKVCITGNLTGTTNITVNGKSELSICSNVKIGTLNVNTPNEFALTVGTSGFLTFNAFNISNTRHTIANYGNLTFNQNLALNTTLSNYANIQVNNNVTVSSNGKLLNYSNSVFNTNKNFNNSGELYNAGLVTILKNYDQEASAKFVNECRFLVGGNLTMRSNFTNSGQISVGSKFIQNAGFAQIIVYANSSILTRDLDLNGETEIFSVDGKAAIEVTGSTILNNSINVTNGLLDFCDNNGIESGESNILGSNVSYCKVYMESNDCRSNTIGSPQVVDTDNDGVDDAHDVEPLNDQVAYYSYSPNADTWSKFISEDLWPYQGDYDFNDVVYRYRVRYSEHANGKVVSAQITGLMDCVSGGIHSGFAFRFLNGETGTAAHFSSNIIESVTAFKPNTYSAASMKNTIVIADDIYKLQSKYYSNDGTGPSGPSEIFEANIMFEDLNLRASNILIDNFIFHTNEPGVEIHTANFPPTERADASKIGTGQDASNAANNKYYVNKNNYPWALVIFQDTQVRHAKSKMKITDAFPQIVDWIKSGGRENKDWYTNADSRYAFIE